jgi:hypothetical protein
MNGQSVSCFHLVTIRAIPGGQTRPQGRLHCNSGHTLIHPGSSLYICHLPPVVSYSPVSRFRGFRAGRIVYLWSSSCYPSYSSCSRSTQTMHIYAHSSGLHKKAQVLGSQLTPRCWKVPMSSRYRSPGIAEPTSNASQRLVWLGCL